MGPFGGERCLAKLSITPFSPTAGDCGRVRSRRGGLGKLTLVVLFCFFFSTSVLFF
jgi:hypothetical protein